MIRAATLAEMRAIFGILEYAASANACGVVFCDVRSVKAFVGYDCWTPNSVQMHIWVAEGVSLPRKFVREAFRYPFEQCGRGLVIGLTPGYNSAALEFNRRIGFREAYRVPDGWSLGTDVVIQEMRRDECRWISQRFHEQVSPETA